MNEKKLRAAVIGTGHMGRHHVRIYSEMNQVELTGVVDANSDRAAEMAANFNCKPFTDVSQIIDQIDLASIAVPTIHHLSVAEPLIRAGKAVLIEKPLAPDSRQGRKILDLAREFRTPVQVGHTERFNPVVRAMKRLDITPRFIETHRISPFTFRSADIGVVLDMMIHDIDIVLSLVGKIPVNVDAVGVAVLGKFEDIANARLTFDDGCVANLTASRLALKTERKIRVFSNQAYLSLDYQKKTGIAIKKDANADILQLAHDKKIDDLAQLANNDYSKLVKVEPIMMADEEPLRAELESFVNAVIAGTEPEVSAQAGLDAVETAERIVQSISEHNFKL
ncbi:MAG: Gfo/Idh/MocA family oxidoreductase [Phycisphaerae bacterium]|nr:Gfo/Idh/MocA family oxidoreductase [Phycisphaerae bacterium]